MLICAKEPVVSKTGIYFLIDSDQVVYVGQSVNCQARVFVHDSQRQKAFSHYSIIECPAADLNKMEAYYIWLLQPKYNRSMPDQDAFATFRTYVSRRKIYFHSSLHKKIKEHCKAKRFWMVDELDTLFNIKTA